MRSLFWTSRTDGPWEQRARLHRRRIARNTKFATSVNREATRLLSRGTKCADRRSVCCKGAETEGFRFSCWPKDAHENPNENCVAGYGCAWFLDLGRWVARTSRGFRERHRRRLGRSARRYAHEAGASRRPAAFGGDDHEVW